MSRRGKRGGMAALGNSMKTHHRRHNESAMMRASGFGRRRKGRDSGLTGWFIRGFGGRKKGGMVSQVGYSLRERLSPTERAQIAEDSEQAIRDEKKETGQNDNIFIRFMTGVINRMRGR